MQVQMLRVPKWIRPSLMTRLRDQTNILRNMKLDALFHVLPVPAWLLSMRSAFLLQSKDMHDGLTGKGIPEIC